MSNGERREVRRTIEKHTLVEDLVYGGELIKNPFLEVNSVSKFDKMDGSKKF